MAPEHLDVGVAEAVDRLVLVADPEQVVPIELFEQLVLERVGVLELVHQHVGEALGVLAPQALVVGEQLRGEQLQVLEVEGGARPLAPLVALAVELQQRAQQSVVAVLAVLAAERRIGGQRVPVLDARLGAQGLGAASKRELVELPGLGQRAGRHPVEHAGEALELVDRLPDPHPGAGAAQLAQSRVERVAQALGLAAHARRAQLAQARMTLPAAAQARIGGAHHVAQRVGGVRGDHLEAVGIGVHESLQRAVERVGGDSLRLQLAEHAELRIDAGTEGVRAQHACAEAVDRRDPGALGRARLGATIQLDEAAAHAGAHLGGRLLGERDREDRVHRHPVLDHRLHEPLDQHRRLAGARPGAHDQRMIAAPDGALLLLGERLHPSHLQIAG